MPKFMSLEPVAPSELRRMRGLPAAKEHKTKFPKRTSATRVDARTALKRWQETQPVPTLPRNPEVPIEAVRPTRADFAKLREVAESEVAPAEILKQKLTEKKLFGTLYSALATYGYMEMQGEYKRRKAKGRDLAATEQTWRQVVAAAQKAYAAGGVQAKPADLDRFVRELTASDATYNTVKRIANEAEKAKGLVGRRAITANMRVTAAFVPIVDRVLDPSTTITPIAGLCDQPFAEGSFTKHFSRSVALSVQITYWCPTWTNPFRTCTKTVTLAGVSFTVSVNVGYKITCCGATAWGQGFAQACATIVGINVCASCSATITAVAGVSRTPVGSGCSYGLGINAVLQCKFAGATILNLSWPFGWTVTAPCPPAGLCA